jgi:hypothetical protein
MAVPRLTALPHALQRPPHFNLHSLRVLFASERLLPPRLAHASAAVARPTVQEADFPTGLSRLRFRKLLLFWLLSVLRSRLRFLGLDGLFQFCESLPDALHVGKTQGLIIEGFAVRAVLTWGRDG